MSLLFKKLLSKNYVYKFYSKRFQRNFHGHLLACAKDMLKYTVYLKKVDKMDFEHSAVLSYVNGKVKDISESINLFEEFLAVARGDIQGATDSLFSKFGNGSNTVMVTKEQVCEMLTEHAKKLKLDKLGKVGSKNEVH